MERAWDKRLTQSLFSRDSLIIVGWFVVSRVVLLLGLAWEASRHHQSLSNVLTVFDGAYYREIAAHGYPASLPVGPQGVLMSPVGFFPLFPALTRVGEMVGLPFAAAASVVTFCAGLLASLLIRTIVASYAPDAVALGVALLWSVQPLAFVLALTYSEALYSALAAGTLVMLLRERWLVAGVLAAAASLTRPAGLVLVLCVAVAAVPLLRSGSATTATRWRAFAACLLAPTGFLTYMTYLGAHTGRIDAWFVTERQGWGVYTDGGRETAQRFLTYLLHPGLRPAATGVAVLLIISVILAAMMLRQGVPAPLAVFALASLLLAVGTRNVYSSIPRFLLPASFPLLVPLVRGLHRAVMVVSKRVGRTVESLELPTNLAVATAGLCVMTAAGVYATTISQFPP